MPSKFELGRRSMLVGAAAATQKSLAAKAAAPAELPPVPARTVELSGDGFPMQCFVGEPKAQGKYPAVFICMHADWGFDGWLKSVVERLAGQGYVVVAMNSFYRSGPESTSLGKGTKKGDGSALFESEHKKMLAMKALVLDAQFNSDARIVLDYIKQHPKADPKRIGCLGFCMGGGHAWTVACLNRDIKAMVMYYPGEIIVSQQSLKHPISPLSYAPLLTCPVMGNYGGKDVSVVPAEERAVKEVLEKLGKVHDFKMYEGIGHAFACTNRLEYNAEAAEDAWVRTLGWFKKYL